MVEASGGHRFLDPFSPHVSEPVSGRPTGSSNLSLRVVLRPGASQSGSSISNVIPVIDTGLDRLYIDKATPQSNKGVGNVLILSFFFLFTLLFAPVLLLLPLVFCFLLLYFFCRTFCQVSLIPVFIHRYSSPRSPPF